jgi:hypothetical protein
MTSTKVTATRILTILDTIPGHVIRGERAESHAAMLTAEALEAQASDAVKRAVASEMYAMHRVINWSDEYRRGVAIEELGAV